MQSCHQRSPESIHSNTLGHSLQFASSATVTLTNTPITTIAVTTATATATTTTGPRHCLNRYPRRVCCFECLKAVQASRRQASCCGYQLLRLQAKRGQGQPVLALPGFMTGDTSTIVLRTFLSGIGYKTQG